MGYRRSAGRLLLSHASRSSGRRSFADDRRHRGDRRAVRLERTSGPDRHACFWRYRGARRARKSEIFKRLFSVVHPFAAHTTLFWLECFAVRYPDGRIDATCRKHNDDWEEGKQALLLWAADWPLHEKGFVSQRRFILFNPPAVKDR